MITTGEYMGKADLNNIEIAAMFLAAAVHDYEHPYFLGLVSCNNC